MASRGELGGGRVRDPQVLAEPTFMIADQLLFDQFEEGWVADGDLAAQAQADTLDSFRLVFADAFMKTIVRRMDGNAEIFQRILDDRDFQSVVMNHYVRRVFDRPRTDLTASPGTN